MVLVKFCKRAHLAQCGASPVPAKNKTKENTGHTDHSKRLFIGLSLRLVRELSINLEAF